MSSSSSNDPACVIQDSLPRCDQVTNPSRIFESRSACENFFLQKYTNKFTTSFMTIPIILSLAPSSQIDQLYSYSIRNLYYNIKDTSVNDSEGNTYMPDITSKLIDEVSAIYNNDFKTSLINLIQSLFNCNKSWNEKTDKTFIQSATSNIDIKMVRDNDFYSDLLDTQKFYKEILGVINRDNWVERENTYFDLSTSTLRAPRDWDNICSGRTNSECNKNEKPTLSASDPPQCKLRKGTCINSERYRSFDSDSSSMYIFKSADSKNGYVLFKCLFKYHMVVANSGIFQSYYPKYVKIGNTGKFLTKYNEKSNVYTVTFPPFDFAGFGNMSDATKTVCQLASSVLTFYANARLVAVTTKKDGKKVGVLSTMYTLLMNWYKDCFSKANIKKDAIIRLVGTSLGGALANMAAFVLHENGYTDIHLYACGSPRVGNKDFNDYMSSGNKLSKDSGNYIRFNSVIKNNTFYTQYDPITKFPPSSGKGYIFGNYEFYTTPLTRIIGSGLTWNLFDDSYDTQPDYDHIATGSKLSSQTPLRANCAYWGQVHSVDSYNMSSFLGENLIFGEGRSKPGKYYDECMEGVKNLDILKLACPDPASLSCVQQAFQNWPSAIKGAVVGGALTVGALTIAPVLGAAAAAAAIGTVTAAGAVGGIKAAQRYGGVKITHQKQVAKTSNIMALEKDSKKKDLDKIIEETNDDDETDDDDDDDDSR